MVAALDGIRGYELTETAATPCVEAGTPAP